MIQTKALHLLCQVLSGLKMLNLSSVQNSYYNAKGAECFIEYEGQAYRIIVEHVGQREEAA